MNLKTKGNYTLNEPIKNIEFHHLTISQKISIIDATSEILLVLLKGRIEVMLDKKSVLERKDVFSQKASAVYIPNNVKAEIIPKNQTEIVIIKTKAKTNSNAKIILPNDINEEIRGNVGFRRKVYNILDESAPSKKLVVGETINFSGEWSSFPPHKHDTNSKEEAKMEEIYLFKLNPPDGFGLQRIYTQDNCLNEALVIENNDIVLIPVGYHPLVVIPGYELYYLWALVGDTKKLKPKTQEKFRWLIK